MSTWILLSVGIFMLAIAALVLVVLAAKQKSNSLPDDPNDIQRLVVSTLDKPRPIVAVVNSLRQTFGVVRHPHVGKRLEHDKPVHIYVALCDYFEPFWGGVSQEMAEHRVMTWCREYARSVKVHADSLGHNPSHTFFYVEQDYNPRFVDALYKLYKEKLCDIEMAYHPRGSEELFRRSIEEFRDVLFHHHGLLRKDSSEKAVYGFFRSQHTKPPLSSGNQDLDHQVAILKQTGCYADFSYPLPGALPLPYINCINFSDRPGSDTRMCRSCQVLQREHWSDSDLLVMQGPAYMNWRRRSWGLLPRIDDGAVGYHDRITPERIDRWIRNGITIQGLQEHVFIRLHTRGTLDSCIRYLFGEEGLHMMWTWLESCYNDSTRYHLHYVTAWEMYSTIRDLCRSTDFAQSSKHATR